MNYLTIKSLVFLFCVGCFINLNAASVTYSEAVNNVNLGSQSTTNSSLVRSVSYTDIRLPKFQTSLGTLTSYTINATSSLNWIFGVGGALFPSPSNYSTGLSMILALYPSNFIVSSHTPTPFTGSTTGDSSINFSQSLTLPGTSTLTFAQVSTILPQDIAFSLQYLSTNNLYASFGQMTVGPITFQQPQSILSITYNYTPAVMATPEPSTYLILGSLLALPVLLFAKKNVAKRMKTA